MQELSLSDTLAISGGGRSSGRCRPRREANPGATRARPNASRNRNRNGGGAPRTNREDIPILPPLTPEEIDALIV